MSRIKFKVTTLLILLGLTICYSSCSKLTNENKGTINPIIGDVSFVNVFGIRPTEKTDGDLRIKTHLQYVEQELRNKEVLELSSHQQKNRKQVLNLLNEYWTQGVFPRNYDYQGTRKPCFVDKENRLCAVAFLIDQTVGKDAVIRINQNFKYDYILDMEDNIINEWIENSGLTRTEYAMIQPTYNYEAEPVLVVPEPEPEEVSPRWTGNGEHKKVNKNKQLTEKGWFKDYQLVKGKKYYYDQKGALTRIEIYKEGKYVKDVDLKVKKG